MLWIMAALIGAGGFLGFIAMVLSRRGGYDELGLVSSRWIANHRADSH